MFILFIVVLLSLLLLLFGLNEIRTHDTAFKVPGANRYTIRPQLSVIAQITLVLILYIIF